jgi:hypothetical protein
MKSTMKNYSSVTSKVRLVSFLLLLWFAGIGLALWLGLGWFFLVETIRRFIISIPIVYIKFLRMLVSPQRAAEEKQLLTQHRVRMLYLWRLVVALIWLALTVVVFLYANIKLADLLR